jgi:hypothetical protein
MRHQPRFFAIKPFHRFLPEMKALSKVEKLEIPCQ